MNHRSIPRLVVGAIAIAAVAAQVGAQTFPARSVTLTVGFAPGGGTDTAARVSRKKACRRTSARR